MAFRTIDAHVGGGALRLVVEGFPAARGATMLDKRDWAARHAERLRRRVLFEPRGHTGLCAAVLTEPTTPGATAGVLFMTSAGWAPMSGHGVVAVSTISLRERLFVPGGDGHRAVLDTPAGRVSITASGSGFEHVTFVNVPAFVLHGGVPLQLPTRRIRADVAFGGAFYAIVDSEEVGVPLGGAHLGELGRRAAEIRHALEPGVDVVHPAEPRLKGLDGVIFTGPANDPKADLRHVVVRTNGAAGRSPGGTSTAAIMAVLDAMGLLGEAVFTLEGPVGSTSVGKVVGRTVVGGTAALIAELEGTAWITGQHTFLVAEDDPFPEGFQL